MVVKKGGILGGILTGQIDVAKNAETDASFAYPSNPQASKARVQIDRVREIDPNRCRLWKFADRPEDEAVHVQDVASSMDDIEQITPVIVREISIDDPDYPNIEYEIIAGSVRWRASKVRNKPLKVIVKSLTDRQAVSVMIAENEHRRGITPFARSLQMQTVWESGMFDSQDDLANTHSMDKSKASMYLKVAANADFLRKMYGDSIKDIGLRQLYDACNFERSDDSLGKQEEKPKAPFYGFHAKTNKQGVTTIKIVQRLSDEQVQRIRSIIEEVDVVLASG